MVANRRLVAVLGQIACPAGVSFQGTTALKLNLERLGYVFLTAILFLVGKFLLGLYLSSGAAGSAYGAASSLVTLLLWVFYSAQLLLFGAEFTKVYANTYGSHVEPEEHAVKVERREIELPRKHGSERARSA